LQIKTASSVVARHFKIKTARSSQTSATIHPTRRK
jgi:hypothetical protein